MEGSSNFISRLHSDELFIVPWPVIESRSFYRMFRRLGKMLQERPITHTKGAIFLEVMKTLMAKLKVHNSDYKPVAFLDLV